MSNVSKSIALIIILCVFAIVAQADTYSPGGWATLHKDAGNRRSVDAEVAERSYEQGDAKQWHALRGATVLTARFGAEGAA